MIIVPANIPFYNTNEKTRIKDKLNNDKKHTK